MYCIADTEYSFLQHEKIRVSPQLLLQQSGGMTDDLYSGINVLTSAALLHIPVLNSTMVTQKLLEKEVFA